MEAVLVCTLFSCFSYSHIQTVSPRPRTLHSIFSRITYFPNHANGVLTRKTSEVRSGTHNNGGANPDWTRKNNFFTFYVPSNVALERQAVVLEVYDSNTMSADKMIGTCGKIPLKGVRRF